MKYRIKWKVCLFFEEGVKISIQCDPIFFFFFLFRRGSWYFSVSKLGHLTCPPPPPAPFLLLSGRESQHRGHGAATEHPSGERAGRAWAGEAARPRGLLRGHQEEAGGGRGEQGTSSPGPRSAWPLAVWGRSARLCSNRFSFPPTPLNPRGSGTSSPKGRSVCHRSCELEDVLIKTFPSCLFPSDPLTCAGGLSRWTVTPSLRSSLPSLCILAFPWLFLPAVITT